MFCATMGTFEVLSFWRFCISPTFFGGGLLSFSLTPKGIDGVCNFYLFILFRNSSCFKHFFRYRSVDLRSSSHSVELQIPQITLYQTSKSWSILKLQVVVESFKFVTNFSIDLPSSWTFVKNLYLSSFWDYSALETHRLQLLVYSQ